MESNGVCFPSDMLIEILTRLPIKSIIRFRSVAKTWQHLFQTSSFVSQHQSLNKNKQQLGLARHHRGWWRSTVHMTVLDATDLHRYQDGKDAKDAVLSLLDATDFHQPLSDLIFRPSVEKGLVCLHSPEKPYITIWNPATREHRVIYKGNLEEIAFGFGFDSLSNDYKAICIHRDEATKKVRYTLYQLSKDSWRDLKEEEDKFFITRFNCRKICLNSFRFKNTCVNGVLYFNVCIHDSYEDRILAFDLATETSRLIQLPMESASRITFRLIQLPMESANPILIMKVKDNRLGFWDYYIDFWDSYFNYFDFWILNDDQESWTKQMKIKPCLGIRNLYGNIFVKHFIHKGQLMEGGILNDFDTGEFMQFSVPLISVLPNLLNVYPYEETLVPVRRTIEEEKSYQENEDALCSRSSSDFSEIFEFLL